MAKKKVKLPSTPIGRRRLLKGAALLEADAKNTKGIRFDFSVVGYADNPKAPLSCGTVGCALGLFGVSGAFAKQGLSCHIGRADNEISLRFPGTRDTFKAAEMLFQITEAEAEFLFASSDGLPDNLIGARAERAVAKRIRRFVAGKVAPPVDA